MLQSLVETSFKSLYIVYFLLSSRSDILKVTRRIDKKESKVLNAKFYKVNKYVYYYKMAFEKNFT